MRLFSVWDVINTSNIAQYALRNWLEPAGQWSPKNYYFPEFKPVSEAISLLEWRNLFVWTVLKTSSTWNRLKLKHHRKYSHENCASLLSSFTSSILTEKRRWIEFIVCDALAQPSSRTCGLSNIVGNHKQNIAKANLWITKLDWFYFSISYSIDSNELSDISSIKLVHEKKALIVISHH